MIKKSLFAEELAAGMQRELQPFEKKAATTSLVDAVDYLHSAVEIFEEAGMTAKADQVLSILAKIANHGTHVRQMPNMKTLMQAGVTIEDIKSTNLGDPMAKARLNLALRRVGLSDKEIAEFVGPKNVMSEQDAKMLLDPERSFGKINEWFKDPEKPVDPMNPGPNETIEFNSMTHNNDSGPAKPNEIVFKSLLAPDAQAAKADDFLDLDINDAAMEVFDEAPEDKTFEDSE